MAEEHQAVKVSWSVLSFLGCRRCCRRRLYSTGALYTCRTRSPCGYIHMIYVCVYVYIHACMHTYIQTYIYMYIHTYKHALHMEDRLTLLHVPARHHGPVLGRLYLYMHLHLNMHVHTAAPIYACIHGCYIMHIHTAAIYCIYPRRHDMHIHTAAV